MIDHPRASVADYEKATASGSRSPLSATTVEFWDPYSLICTSGTTGASKGVLSPYGQIHAATAYNMIPRARSSDVFLLDAPLFHVGGILSFQRLWPSVGRTGVPFDACALSRYLDGALPYFMVPRSIEEFEESRQTTDQEGYGKVRKAELRARGVSASTWDRYVHMGRPGRDKH